MFSIRDTIEVHIPQRLWPVWVVIVAPIRIWQWTSIGAWCWTMEGKREPFRFRLSIAWAMVKARYWIDPWEAQ